MAVHEWRTFQNGAPKLCKAVNISTYIREGRKKKKKKRKGPGKMGK
jgi:hypothetical protein